MEKDAIWSKLKDTGRRYRRGVLIIIQNNRRSTEEGKGEVYHILLKQNSKLKSMGSIQSSLCCSNHHELSFGQVPGEKIN